MLRKEPRDASYQTNEGDTLLYVAMYEWGSEAKWRELVSLNRRLIGELWWYPDPVPMGEPAWRFPGTLGERILNKAGGHQLLGDGKSWLGDIVPPDLPFREGIVLRVIPAGG
jgi:hypothetical protein